MANVGRLTFYSTKANGPQYDCSCYFNISLPRIPGGYQLAVESFVTASSTATFVLESSGIYSEESWDQAANGSQINLFLNNGSGAFQQSLCGSSVGVKLAGNLSNQTIRFKFRDINGNLFANFPHWIMHILVFPVIPLRV